MRLDLRIALFCGIVVVTPAWAADQLGFAALLAPTSASTLYTYFTANGSADAGRNGRAGIVSSAFTAQTLRCDATSAPGTGNSWTITLQQATFAASSTWNDAGSPAVACTISDTNRACSDLTHTASIAAGDSLIFRVTGAGTPTSVRLACTVSGGSSLTFGVSNFSAPTGSSTVWGAHSVNGSSAIANFPMPIAHSVTAGNLYCASDNPPGGSATWVVTVMRAFNGDENNFAAGGSDTGITCTFTSAAVTCSDVTHTAGFSVNDQLVFQATPTGSPGTSAKIRCSVSGA